MTNRYRTFATDDLSVEVWVNYDGRRYIVNSKSPWHNPCEYGTSYADAYKAVCDAKDTFERLTATLRRAPIDNGQVHPVGCICEACSVAYERQRAF